MVPDFAILGIDAPADKATIDINGLISILFGSVDRPEVRRTPAQTRDSALTTACSKCV